MPEATIKAELQRIFRERLVKDDFRGYAVEFRRPKDFATFDNWQRNIRRGIEVFNTTLGLPKGYSNLTIKSDDRDDVVSCHYAFPFMDGKLDVLRSLKEGEYDYILPPPPGAVHSKEEGFDGLKRIFGDRLKKSKDGKTYELVIEKAIEVDGFDPGAMAEASAHFAAFFSEQFTEIFRESNDAIIHAFGKTLTYDQGEITMTYSMPADLIEHHDVTSSINGYRAEFMLDILNHCHPPKQENEFKSEPADTNSVKYAKALEVLNRVFPGKWELKLRPPTFQTVKPVANTRNAYVVLTDALNDTEQETPKDTGLGVFKIPASSLTKCDPAALEDLLRAKKAVLDIVLTPATEIKARVRK